jgi:ferric-dicitrate binding protein FerR (iron transport regulator)
LKLTQPASTRPITPQPSGRTWIRQWGAIAAVLLFGVGLGFVLQNIQSRPDAGISRKPVAIQVAEVKGTVLVKHRDAQVWETLEADSAVFLGDTFYTTATSNLVLSLGQFNRIEVTPNSMLALESSDKTTEFFLKHGQCTPVLNGPHGPFFIRTPNGRMEALGTEFTVTVTE